MLDDHAHRLAEGGGVDLLGPQQQKSPGPVDRLRDARGLLEVELPDLLDNLHQPLGDGLIELR